MNFKKTALLALTLTCLLLALTGCGTKEPPAGEEETSAAGDAAQQTGPFTEMDTVDLDGNKMDSSVFAEKTLTLVNVWNLGCTPCVQEIPHLDKLNKDLADRGVAVKGLYYNFGEALSDADRTDIEALFAETGADYPQLLASETMMASDELSQIQAFPTTFFVDGEGNIVETVEGSHDYDGWLSIIESVLESVEADA